MVEQTEGRGAVGPFGRCEKEVGLEAVAEAQGTGGGTEEAAGSDAVLGGIAKKGWTEQVVARRS